MALKIPTEYLNLDNDFGFTAVHESDVADPLLDKLESTVLSENKQQLQALEKLIIPLLVNLMKNPEKEYIHWPNRVAQIERQMEKILEITRK